MSWLRIVVWSVLAAALTFHLLEVSRPASPESAKSDPASVPFLQAVPERIDRVRVENDTEAVVFERRDGRWVITEPEGMDTASDIIDAVLESFTTLPPIEVVADGVEHEGQFGLVPPRARVRLEEKGELIATIVLGELSPTRTAVYAKKSGKDEVVLIGLNSKYYLDLVFENLKRQKGGVVKPAAAPPAETAPPNPQPAMPPVP